MFKEFEITSDKLVCSDPCYTTDVWCMGIVENVKNGVWLTKIDISDEGEWGQRVASLTIVNKESLEANPSLNDDIEQLYSNEPLNFSAGVDSGQFGFFDFAHYRNDDSAKELEKQDFGDSYDREGGDQWYRACCHLTLGSEQWGVLPNGVVSSSGFGDGSYDVYGLKNTDGEYIALSVLFIGEDDENDLDGWDEDWLDDDE